MSPFSIDSEKFLTIMPQRRTRRRITLGTLTFCATNIVYLVIWGDADNGLHKQALEYAFVLAGTIATAYSLSAVADNAVVYTRNTDQTSPDA